MSPGTRTIIFALCLLTIPLFVLENRSLIKPCSKLLLRLRLGNQIQLGLKCKSTALLDKHLLALFDFDPNSVLNSPCSKTFLGRLTHTKLHHKNKWARYWNNQNLWFSNSYRLQNSFNGSDFHYLLFFISQFIMVRTFAQVRAVSF